jgi:hypothetical protein
MNHIRGPIQTGFTFALTNSKCSDEIFPWKCFFPNFSPKTKYDIKFSENQSKCGISSTAFLFLALNINLRTGCISLVLHFYVGNSHCMLFHIPMNVEQFWIIPNHHAHDSHGTCKIAHHRL